SVRPLFCNESAAVLGNREETFLYVYAAHPNLVQIRSSRAVKPAAWPDRDRRGRREGMPLPPVCGESTRAFGRRARLLRRGIAHESAARPQGGRGRSGSSISIS